MEFTGAYSGIAGALEATQPRHCVHAEKNAGGQRAGPPSEGSLVPPQSEGGGHGCVQKPLLVSGGWYKECVPSPGM